VQIYAQLSVFQDPEELDSMAKKIIVLEFGSLLMRARQQRRLTGFTNFIHLVKLSCCKPKSSVDTCQYLRTCQTSLPCFSLVLSLHIKPNHLFRWPVTCAVCGNSPRICSACRSCLQAHRVPFHDFQCGSNCCPLLTPHGIIGRSYPPNLQPVTTTHPQRTTPPHSKSRRCGYRQLFHQRSRG
jgi:hypothetical protein